MRLPWVLFLLCYSFSATSQQVDRRWDNWYFFNRTGLKINNCGAVPLLDGNCTEAAGSCTISDTSGNLLFYTNGFTIWNKEHDPMPNGVMEGFWPEGDWMYQGPVLAPLPANDSIYFMFFLNRVWTNFPNDYKREFQYNVINMKKDGGRGDVTVKQQTLYKDPTDAVGAVLHSNNRDYWIVSHKSNSDSFVVHLLTPGGLDPVTRYYKVGPVVSGDYWDVKDIIRISPDRTRLVMSRRVKKDDPQNYEMDGGFDLYHFNAATGEITDPIVIREGFTSLTSPVWDRYFSTGAEFSPNSKNLYIATWDHLYQFDVSSHDYSTINNSRFMVASTDIYSYAFGNLQLGSNGILYLAKYYTDGYIATVNNADIKGAGCDYNDNAVNFPGLTDYTSAQFVGYGLNNSIPPYVHAKAFDSADVKASQTCLQDSTQFTVTSLFADSIRWNFGDPVAGANNISKLFDPKHLYAASGQYPVTAIIYTTCSTDTIKKYITVGKPVVNLGPDKTICEHDTLVLRANVDNVAYKWSNGSILDSIVITLPGKYWLQVTRDGCSVADTMVVTINAKPVIDLPDTTICNGVVLNFNVNQPNIQSYLWSDNKTESSRSFSEPGLYWCQLTGVNGCISRDTMIISETSLPGFTLGPDTSLCKGQEMSFKFSIPSASYLWSNGSTDSAITISQDGLYRLTVTKDGCAVSNQVAIKFKPLPGVSLGDRRVVCEGGSLQLIVAASRDSLRWNNGFTGDPLVVTNPGLYIVEVFKDRCSAKDSIEITLQHKPYLHLGRDTAICLELGLLLTAAQPGVQYLWQNGATTPDLFVNKAGIYSLHVTNECGSVMDDIVITEGFCELAVPTAFTPNYDGLNDYFRILNASLLLTAKLTVFDRWGQKVFETTDANKGWDGKYKGQPMDSGNLMWTLQYEDRSGKKEFRKGMVTLIR